MDIIRTKFKREFKFVKYDPKDLTNIKDFLKTILRAYSIKDPKVNIFLYDEYKSAIDPVDLPFILKKYSGCSHFFLELSVEVLLSQSAQEIIDYLLECGEEGEDLIKFRHSKDRMTKSSRKHLVSLLYDYLNESFNSEPSKDNIISVCKDVIQIFPGLRVSPSSVGGIDLLYGKKGGYLYNKFKNQKEKLMRKMQANLTVSSDADRNECQYSEEEKLELLLFFKTCLIPKDKSKLLQTLKETIQFRKELYACDSTIFADSFKFYFISPDIILSEFEMEFKAEGLFDRWQTMSENVSKYLAKPRHSNSRIFDSIDLDINQFVAILKTLCPMRTSFKNVLDSLIVHNKDPSFDPVELINSKNNHPYIICTGANNKNTQFYIEIQKALIPVPKNFDFLHTMDMFFKAHKVLGRIYNPHLQAFMVFLETFVYDIENTTVKSDRMKELKLQLLDI